MDYYLCSAALIEHMQPEAVSKPFKSGYKDDDDLYYVALLDLPEVGKYYNKVIYPYNLKSRVAAIDFWCRECAPGSMEITGLTKAGIKRNGLFLEIENKLCLTNESNLAMVIYNLSERYGKTPIEFINSIA